MHTAMDERQAQSPAEDAPDEENVSLAQDFEALHERHVYAHSSSRRERDRDQEMRTSFQGKGNRHLGLTPVLASMQRSRRDAEKLEQQLQHELDLLETKARAKKAGVKFVEEELVYLTILNQLIDLIGHTCHEQGSLLRRVMNWYLKHPLEKIAKARKERWMEPVENLLEEFEEQRRGLGKPKLRTLPDIHSLAHRTIGDENPKPREHYC